MKLISNLKRERKQREIYLESMKKEAEQKKLQAERIDRRIVSSFLSFLSFYNIIMMFLFNTSNYNLLVLFFLIIILFY